MELNAKVFIWPEKILSVFEFCDEVSLSNPQQHFLLFIPYRLPDWVHWYAAGIPVDPTRENGSQGEKKDCQHLCFYQVIETAKEKEMDELLAKRGRLRVQLEKVLRRITEFPFFSELDMVQQV